MSLDLSRSRVKSQEVHFGNYYFNNVPVILFLVTGLEWDAPPEMNITVDRPYMFCVRWQNTNLMLGNFVL